VQINLGVDRTADRWAIELLELPNDIPIAYRSTPSADVAPSTSSLILEMGYNCERS